MPVTIFFTPPIWAYTRNQMLLCLTTNNLYSAPNIRRDNFQIVMQLEVDNGGVFDTILTAKVPPNDDGSAYYDISSVLDKYLKDNRISLSEIINIFLPTTGFNAAINPMFCKYRITAWEEYGIPPTQQGASIVSDEMFAYRGGVSEELHAQTFGYLNAIVFGAADALLTFEPDCKPVSDAQYEFRTWFNWTGAAVSNFELGVTAKYADGTTTTLAHAVPSTIPINGMLIFSTGFEQVVAPYFPNPALVVSWEIEPLVGGLPFGRKFKYLRQNAQGCCGRERYLFYLNSLGVPETMRTTGVWKRKLEVDRDYCEKMPAQRYSQADKRKIQHQRDARHIYTVKSGYVSKARQLAAEQLLLAEEVAFLSKNSFGGVYAYPVVLLSEKFEITEYFEELHQLTFDIEASQQLLAYDEVGL